MTEVPSQRNWNLYAFSKVRAFAAVQGTNIKNVLLQIKGGCMIEWEFNPGADTPSKF